MSAITRRQAITAIASISAVAGTGTALAAAPATDDVSALAALIEAHKAAYSAFSNVLDADEETEGEVDKLNAADPILVRISPVLHADLHVNEWPLYIESIYKNRRTSLDHMIKGWPRKFKTAGIKELKREKAEAYKSLAEAQAKLAARHAACGYTEAKRLRDAASNDEDQALWAIYCHRCANRAELGLKAEYLLDTHKRLGTCIQDQEFEALLWSMLPDDDQRVVDDVLSS